MLILLPPSEGKHRPRRGKPLDLTALGSPSLTPARRRVLTSLTEMCAADPQRAREVLGLPESMLDLVLDNADLSHAPTAPAARIYTGVLFAALDLAGLSGARVRRANQRIAIFSALFGVVRPTDRICAYRLSGSVSLPGLGPLPGFWREPLAAAVPALARDGLIVDMRSAPYSAMWAPRSESLGRTVTVKVWQRGAASERVAVSHHNKATKGALARLLATADRVPRRPTALLDLVRDGGWDADLDDSGRSSRLDVYAQA